ncbi:signal peptide peptidase SppA, 67K type [Rubidibacter lacunae KORDI 51-2]|uniref:Protease 4 n=1 Tax=Rubidibacter lacunae KORDI 51-2 TaxID=582515 RepID=U5DJP0_9CHRO|nr:signal peptide peptidase SppA [Rubidibacter lacunae]ERN40799.1 signal peptide peptidase SppA, 67K type [Rubidibacter lacunae KORDI 51-2]
MRQFLRQTFASALGTVIGFALFLGLSFGGLLVLAMAVASRDSGPRVAAKSVLLLDLNLPISDTRPVLSLGGALDSDRQRALALRQVVGAIERASEDDRIVAILLDGSQGSSTTGYATLSEVRAALEAFRAGGKQVFAYDIDWSEREYYLSSLADRIVLHPLGSLTMDGLSSEPVFFAGLLEKLGVGIQVVRVGKFKSAVEPFIRQDLSPENRAQLVALLDDLWGEFLTTVGTSRKLEPSVLQALTDTQAILLPETALGAGLVDEVDYPDRLEAELRDLTDSPDGELPLIPIGTYADSSSTEIAIGSSQKIAVVYAEGSIVSGNGTLDSVGGERFAKVFRKLRYDDDIRAIVLRVNSPGGSATASEIIRREVALARENVPVIVSMGNVAASGGYWIATGGAHIFAEPNTITGSIGVFGLSPNVQELANDNGITWGSVSTGELAESATISRPKTERELAVLQMLADRIYDEFLTVVAEARSMPRDRVAEVAEGRIWSGSEARNIGLVDSIGGLDAAIAYAAEQADLEDNWDVVEYPRRTTFEERLLQRLAAHTTPLKLSTSAGPLGSEWEHLQGLVTEFQQLNDPRGIYARLPFDLSVD